MKPALLIPASLASRALARSDPSDASNWVIGGRNPGEGPANATGTATFRGPDLSTREGSPDIDYEVTIAVYAQVDSNSVRPGAMSSVAVITMRGGDAGKVDDGWTTCLSMWEAGPDSGINEPGDCSTALPEACWFEFPSFDDKCIRDSSDVDGGQGECDAFLGSGISTAREVGDSAPILAQWSPDFDPADKTASTDAYAAAVNKVWIMQLFWSRTDELDSGDSGTSTSSITRFSEPICFQANKTAEASVDPGDRDGDSHDGDGDDDGDSGCGRHGVGALTGWGAAVALMLLAFF